MTLRNRLVSEINKRFKRFSVLVSQTVIDSKGVLKLNAEEYEPLDEADFNALNDEERQKKFYSWAVLVLTALLLKGDSNTNWFVKGIREAYNKGAQKADQEFKRQIGKEAEPIGTFTPFRPAYADLHKEVTDIIFERNFTQLKGITDSVAEQITQELTNGILQGISPKDIAKNIAKKIETVGIKRARLIARTEVIRAYNVAKIREGQRLADQYGMKVYYHWQTAEDSRVRPTHRLRNKKYFTYEMVNTLIGEPNCRCTVSIITENTMPDEVEPISQDKSGTYT